MGSTNMIIDLNDHPDMRVSKPKQKLDEILNAYCPTGEGGGLDNSCSPFNTHESEKEPQKEKTFVGSGTGTRKDPIQCGQSVRMAKKMLAKGHYVHLNGKKYVGKLLDDVAASVTNKKGESMKITDLARAIDVINQFCPTGEGGGVDPTCGKDDSGSGSDGTKTIDGVTVTAPPPAQPGERVHNPDVTTDHNNDGVTDASRVGVPAMSVPPPPSIGRLPNLTPHEREVEHSFIEHYENNPDQVANDFREIILNTTKPGEPPTFGTDDAKVLSDAWSEPDLETRLENRATLNLALHQTANAICKRAFLQHLDTLEPGDNILVTVGGCGAGKGHCLGDKGPPEAQRLKGEAKVVWDSAGDQNATENPWIQKEAEARGLTTTYAYIHADPETQWAHPDRGVVKRAENPKDGRMVDAHVFADSYVLGAQNHQAFYERNKDNPNTKFVFLANQGTPKLLPGIPKEALELDRHKLTEFAIRTVRDGDAPERIKNGATQGERVWSKGDK